MSSAPPLQFTVKTPLLTLAACAALADEPAKRLALRCEDGRLRLAFNIAARPQGRRCIRVAAASLADYLENPEALRTEKPGQARKEIEAIFHIMENALRTESMARLLCCPAEHVRHLIQRRVLTLVRRGRDGRGHSALICKESCIRFLEERRVC